MQEIGHPRSHSCSPGPEEALSEPGKCQIYLGQILTQILDLGIWLSQNGGNSFGGPRAP